jgi:hypothetical protein
LFFKKNVAAGLPILINRALSTRCRAGLPDCFFSNKKSQFWYISDNRGMENGVLYSGHLEYFTTVGYILGAFG